MAYVAREAAAFLGRPPEECRLIVLHLGNPDAFPSAADVFYLSLYPAMGLGLALLVRRVPGVSLDASLLDSSTIAVGAGLLSWVTLIHPLAQDSTLSMFGRCVSMAYPIAGRFCSLIASAT